jgi:predicted permease
MSSILKELRHAVRALLRAPVVATSAVVCIGLGVGATTAITSAIDRALLQPLPFRQPERLVMVYRTTPHFNTGPFSAPNYSDLARLTRQLDGMAAISHGTALLSLPEEAVQITAYRASGNLFRILGARPLRGRLFLDSDDSASEVPVVVMSEEFWRERFGADSSLVGRTITLDGRSHTVLGILPPDFRVPHAGLLLRPDAWVPMRFSPEELGRRRSNYLRVIGRLAEGATAESATSELVRTFDGIVESFPQLRGESVRVVPMRAESARTVRGPLLMVLGAVGMVLLIAATNVASLLLARGVHRRREVAIRTALGGARWQVMRPALAESAVLVGSGLLLGLVLALVGVRTIGALAAARMPHLIGLAIDGRVIAFAALLSIVVGLLCGAIPAWRGSSVDPQDALRGHGGGGGTGTRHHRALNGLVVAEVALSLVLLIGAGLVLKGFSQLLRADPGFDPAPILTLKATVSPDRYPDSIVVRRFLEPALAAVRQLPGVEEASAISMLPYENWGSNFNVRYEGQPGDDPTQRPLVENRVVTPEFFAVTGQRLRGGRSLAAGDDERPEAPVVVVVNEALVRRDFEGRDPIGKRFHIGDTTFATIVGVVSDIRNFGPVQDPRPEAYWPYRQTPDGALFPIVVRVRDDDPMAVLPAVRAAIMSVDRNVAITDARPMRDVIARSVGRPRFFVTLIGVFASVALVLAVSGIYGVMSYAVAQRTREFGIRTALGSTTGRTLRLVTGRGMRLVAIGALVGLAGGAAITRVLQGLLYGVSPLDRVTWTLATLALAGVGLLATLLPAYRATRVDPLIAMRSE